MKKLVLLVSKIALIVVALVGLVFGCAFYVNWHAEIKAKAFCDNIPVGSDISETLENAKKRDVFHSDFAPYNFYFFGFVFDKAVCEVSIDSNRKVTAKHSEMEYD